MILPLPTTVPTGFELADLTFVVPFAAMWAAVGVAVAVTFCAGRRRCLVGALIGAATFGLFPIVATVAITPGEGSSEHHAALQAAVEGFVELHNADLSPVEDGPCGDQLEWECLDGGTVTVNNVVFRIDETFIEGEAVLLLHPQRRL